MNHFSIFLIELPYRCFFYISTYVHELFVSGTKNIFESRNSTEKKRRLERKPPSMAASAAEKGMRLNGIRAECQHPLTSADN